MNKSYFHTEFQPRKRTVLGERLVAEELISERDLARARIAKREMGCFLGEAVVRLGLVEEKRLALILAEVLGVSFADIGLTRDRKIQVANLSTKFLAAQQVLPIAETDNEVVCVTPFPQDEFIKKAIFVSTGKSVELQLGLAADVALALQDADADDQISDPDPLAGQVEYDDEFVEHLRDLAREAPVIQRVNQVIQRAMDLDASDVHIEHFEEALQIRYRVDGVLQEKSKIPERTLADAVVSRLKLLANLNIAERRLPQDGRIMMRVKGHELDLRVSTLPTVHGEGVVLRLLDRGSAQLDLVNMGFSKKNLEDFSHLLRRPHGLVLLSGPTGSGKTTTLYAALSGMDSDSAKIITAEDPVEYQLEGINQIPVNSQIGLNFARALRSILRQDPDVIMVGEMRDSETAQIAVQSALTGHLVLSTLHTNTAAGALVRLEDMGVERFLITSSVNGVLSQRLIRKLCEQCKRQTTVDTRFMRDLDQAVRRRIEGCVIYEGVGCATCNETGYRGRTAIHELFVLDAKIQRHFLNGCDSSSLHALARERGMRTLYEDGLDKVISGVTSLDELMRVTQDQAESDLPNGLSESASNG